jgi:hypothetical protein
MIFLLRSNITNSLDRLMQNGLERLGRLRIRKADRLTNVDFMQGFLLD